MDQQDLTPFEQSSLKLPERFGVFLWWPEDGTDWIYPDDVELVSWLIPGNRIFQLERADDQWSRLSYGKIVVRIKPVMWLEVAVDGYLVGDRVEIRSNMGKKRPAIATICEMQWNRQKMAVEYRVECNGTERPESFYFSDIQPAFRLDEPMSLRQSELAARARLGLG